MNNKGLTIVELLVSFVLISIILVGIVSIIFTYRTTITTSSYKTKLYEYKNNITKDIYSDIINKKVTKVEQSGKNVKFYFGDNTSKNLVVDISDLRNKKIIYGNRIYKIEDPIPESVFSASDVAISASDYQNIIIDDNIHFQNSNGIFRVSINISFHDYAEDFSIYVVYKLN